ncbi:glycosyltransferase family 4 protein [Geomonas anaerohicana]|uniref:Glycosyltransferase family 4 protein n=1 Tax=Geomonas anaerohicana TaxID=2798583 RepID=A0ABS0YH36_9BACT|nr:glycosyltransferase family 4 protein [Geomonas anaerohicana]MBJ6751578.1 glycosyltransferase family 4 protein [Geomonas anaerohicana]
MHNNNTRIHLITKNFAHHSRFSGYDRLLEFLPNSPLRNLPIARLVGKAKKDEMIAQCPARWDHYGLEEINRELDILYTPYLFRKHILHFLYGENTFCYCSDFNRNKKVLLATYHQPEAWFSSSGMERYEYFTGNLKKLDGVIAVSNDQRDFFRNFNPNVFCVHHGIDVDFFCPGAPEERDPTLCLFVGNWLRDFETLKQCSLILKSAAPDVKIQVVTPEKNRPLLEGAAVEIFSGISDTDLREKYRKASVALLPLQDCTANNSALEAMACGLPIVVSDIGGIRDYVQESFGVFCARGNAEEMAHAIIAMLSDSHRRTEMGAAARKCAEDSFAWPVVARKMLEVYEHFLKD